MGLEIRLGYAAIIFSVICSAVTLCPAPARAEIFGNVQGIVHDPQHRPIQNVGVDLKALRSDYAQHQTTNENGEFNFSAVPLGEYIVTVNLPGFQQVQQNVVVASGTSPVLHFQLVLASISEKTVVTGEPVAASVDSVTPTTLLNREEIQQTPGA